LLFQEDGWRRARLTARMHAPLFCVFFPAPPSVTLGQAAVGAQQLPKGIRYSSSAYMTLGVVGDLYASMKEDRVSSLAPRVGTSSEPLTSKGVGVVATFTPWNVH